MRTLLLLAGLAAAFSLRAEPTCSVLSGSLASLDSRLQSAFGKVRDINPEILGGKRVPKWEDFDHVDQILGLVKELKADSRYPELEPKLRELLPDLAAAFAGEYPALARPGAPGARTYEPTEYELLHAYQLKIAELNGLLPKEVRLPLVRLPKDPRLTALPGKGREIVRRLEPQVEALYPTTGFASEADFLKAVEAAGPEAQAILKALQDDTVRVAIRRPARGRFWIEKVGFHNQFVTKSSNGVNNNDRRNQVESDYLGMSKSEYAAFDPELKPQYVYFKPPEGSAWKENIHPTYGDDIYVLKKENIRDRLTFTPGDSLNRHSNLNGKPTSWDELMVPWKYRTLMAPFLIKSVRVHQTFKVGDERPSFTGELGKFREKRGVDSEYSEGQVWGGLKMDDVAEFHFTKTPPEGDFLRSLVARGIKIYDARTNVDKPTPWGPPAP